MDFSKYKLKAKELSEKAIGGVNAAFLQKVSAPVWNRLEGRPRGEDFKRTLKAEVRDALWMLTRQWQMGEFAGEDAGTPVFANLRYNCSPLLKAGNAPLEAEIERQRVFGRNAQSSMNLNLRVQMGNYWLKLLSGDAQLKRLKAQFLGKAEYALSLGTAGKVSNDAAQYLELYRGRTFDGQKFFLDEKRFDSFSAAERDRLGVLFGKFKRWYGSLFYQPGTDAENRWKDSQLEYSDVASVVGTTTDPQFQNEKTLEVREYCQGNLEWYNFEISDSKKIATRNPAASRIKPLEYHQNKSGVKKLLPAQITFDGMPESRFWAFEDGGTNFASITAGKNDLGKLALIEFGLIYANDWSLLPIKVPIGSYVQVEVLSVVDSFGKDTSIPSASQGKAISGDRWSFFTLDKIKSDGISKADDGIFYPPSLARSLQSKPLEEVRFIRDEMANLVWGIETIVQTPLGEGVSGREFASKDVATAKGAKWTYRKRSPLPANWIPFMPVKTGDKTVLRRGFIRDEKSGDPIRPLTEILRYGLRSDGAWDKNYDLDESEVTRDGIIVSKVFRRTRWTNGEVYVWLGMKKQAGKGEGSSGLSFDQIAPAI